MGKDLFSALARVNRVAPSDDASAPLTVAVREAATLTGGDLLVLRLPDGPTQILEIRLPDGARWPPARLLRRWHASAVQRMRPVELTARELHDGPLQLLSGIMLHLRLVRTTADAKSGEALQGLEIELAQAIRQTRALIRHLRVTHSEATIEQRIRDALTRLERTRGVSWSLRWRSLDGAMKDSIADEVFQIINEVLANVYRHSSAKHVEVWGRARDDAFEVTVRDDGVGFDVAQALRMDSRRLSFGLISMQERVTALGEKLIFRSQSGRGTRVLISLPLGGLASPRRP